jgi:hypothetical protein
MLRHLLTRRFEVWKVVRVIKVVAQVQTSVEQRLKQDSMFHTLFRNLPFKYVFILEDIRIFYALYKRYYLRPVNRFC